MAGNRAECESGGCTPSRCLTQHSLQLQSVTIDNFERELFGKDGRVAATKTGLSKFRFCAGSHTHHLKTSFQIMIEWAQGHKCLMLDGDNSLAIICNILQADTSCIKAALIADATQYWDS